MSPNIDRERAFVIGLYPGRGWKKKVDRMDDKQIIAIYLREMRKPKNKSKPKEESDETPF